MKRLNLLLTITVVALLISACSNKLSPTGSKAKVSKDEFEKIQVGMTLKQVTKIVGGECTLQSESGEKGTEFHTVIYGCDGEGDIGANVLFTFQGEKLQDKTQVGLK